MPKAVFGEAPLPGYLVVDRYSGYTKVPCTLQYCSSQLLREGHDREREFPEAAEVTTGVHTVAPLLALAMGRRSQAIAAPEFAQPAAALKAQISAGRDQPAPHLGIRHIQDIFRAHADRLYHWAADRQVPAENTRAARDLRPTVIARKVSVGSQSDAGAQTRGILMAVLHTLTKRQVDVVAHRKGVLARLATNLRPDAFPWLFPSGPP